MYVWRNVSSPKLVVCYFRWFDEMSVFVLEAVTSLTEKAGQERKRLRNIYIFVGLNTGSQNERESVCVVSVIQNGESELSL